MESCLDLFGIAFFNITALNISLQLKEWTYLVEDLLGHVVGEEALHDEKLHVRNFE